MGGRPSGTRLMKSTNSGFPSLGGWHDGEAAEPAELKLLALASRAGDLSALVNHTMEQISQRELRRGDLLLGAEPRRAESEALDRELGNEIDIKDCSSIID